MSEDHIPDFFCSLGQVA